MADGAKLIVRNFKTFVETGKITFSARIMLLMFAIMAPLIPESISAKNWPIDRITPKERNDG